MGLELTREEEEFIKLRRESIRDGRITMTPAQHKEHIQQVFPQIMKIAEAAVEKGTIRSITYELEYETIPKEESSEGMVEKRLTGNGLIVVIIGGEGQWTEKKRSG